MNAVQPGVRYVSVDLHLYVDLAARWPQAAWLPGPGTELWGKDGRAGVTGTQCRIGRGKA
jgi:hypothetical protein